MRVAVLGLGRMGSAMACRLLDSGHHVTVWNRTAARVGPLVERGAVPAADPAAAVTDAQAVIVMLADGPAVTAVVSKAIPALPRAAVLVQMSTIGPDATTALAAGLPPGTRLLDAPVGGSVPRVLAGELTVLVGGADADVTAVADVLASLGTVRRCGPVGTASAAKLVVNTAMIASLAVLAEVESVAAALGVAPESAGELLADGPLGPAVRRAAATRADFPIRLAAKDLRLATGGLDDLGLLSAAATRLSALADTDRDLAAVVTAARARRHHDARGADR